LRGEEMEYSKDSLWVSGGSCGTDEHDVKANDDEDDVNASLRRCGEKEYLM
jgi:hypothetical protein